MSVIVWNFGANAQLEQGYGGVAFNWLSGEAVVEVVDFATAEWSMADGPAHFTLTEELAHWTDTNRPAHWTFET